MTPMTLGYESKHARKMGAPISDPRPKPSDAPCRDIATVRISLHRLTRSGCSGARSDSQREPRIAAGMGAPRPSRKATG